MLPPLAVRAVNHARREYLPTYLGLRLLFNSIPKDSINDWVYRFSKLSGTTKTKLQYNKYNILKGIGQAGRPEFRVCFAPAPTTLLAEIYTLYLMQASGAFNVRPQVYSYRWPERDSGYPYEFFMHGYQSRKIAVASALSESRDYVAVVTDIKSFYPSCDQNRLLKKLESRLLLSNLDKSDNEIIYWFAENLFTQNQNSGIPIGSALGHAFGHIALEDLDHILSKKFGEYYFRYVDDITIVAPISQADEVRRTLEMEIKNAGYDINGDKTETVLSSDWDEPDFRDVLGESFIKLRENITLFLSLYPERYEEIYSALLSNGVNLPLEQFKRVSEYGRFLLRVRRLLQSMRTEVSIQRILVHADVLQLELRNKYEALLKEQAINRRGLKRKWYVQRLRWCLNRLIYLSNSDYIKHLFDTLPEYDELEPTRAILADLINGKISEVTQFPGPTVNAFAQLWRQTRRDEKGIIDAVGAFGLANIDAVGAVGIWGLSRKPDDFFPNEPSASDRAFLDFCFSIPPSTREMDDLSYIDEIRTLQIGNGEQATKKIMSSRFDDKEAVFLDGLMIGTGTSS